MQCFCLCVHVVSAISFESCSVMSCNVLFCHTYIPWYVQTSLERGFGYLFRRLDETAQELLLSTSTSSFSSSDASAPLAGAFLHTALSVYDYGTPSGSGGAASVGGEVGYGQRWVDPAFFGTPLSRLLQSEARCRSSHISRNVGIPNQLDAMLTALHQALHVKGLFQRGAAVADIQALRLSLENEAGVPSHTSPHAIASCLLQWLYELPEPLLGFDMYDAFQACQRDIESEGHRMRNFALLVEAAPWYNKPTLHRIMTLLKDLLTPESSKATGLTSVVMSNLLASCLLRSSDCAVLVHEDALSRESLDRVMRTTAACGPVAEVLISQTDTIFRPLNAHMLTLQEALRGKVTSLKAIQGMAVRFISDLAEEEQEQEEHDSSSKPVAASLQELWHALAESESLLLAASGKSHDENTSSGGDEVAEKEEADGRQSMRWEMCLPQPASSSSGSSGASSESSSGSEAVLAMFDGLPGGLLAVQSLSLFLKL